MLTYTPAIADVFKKQNNHHHQCVPVDTGSIIEHFGVPLSSNRYQGPLSNSLRTDHDVMFIVNDLVAQFRVKKAICLINCAQLGVHNLMFKI